MKLAMRATQLSMSVACCLAGLAMANVCLAGDDIEIVKAEGVVATTDASGKQEQAVTTKSVLPPKNILTTGSNGRAVVRMGNSGYVVLEKNSRIEIDRSKDNVGFLRQVTGMIYYAINTINRNQKKLEVRTPTATIGVRGTRFMIAELPERKEIDMRKGLVSVTSPEGDFEIHRKAELDEFEAYKQQAKDAIAKQKKEFDEYKAKSEREFIEYKREFSLAANRMASFDGKQVEDRPLSAESIRDLESVESYADEWLKEVRD